MSGTPENNNKNEINRDLDNWLTRARQWPQRKKLNFIFGFTGVVILILIIIWLLIGSYKPTDGSSAQSTINGIINSLKHP